MKKSLKLLCIIFTILLIGITKGNLTCSDYGYNCGNTTDQCGNIINCGTCSGADKCLNNICQACTNFCVNQTSTCSTSIRGRVMTPNGLLPVAGMFIYVPNGVLGPKKQGAFCGSGCPDITGDPLEGVWATTGSDGTFTVNNMPAGPNITLVVANLLWRRVFQISVTACTVNNLGNLNLPANKNQGSIPRIAVVTGNQDRFECIFRNVGINDSEFTNPTGTGSINLYQYNGAYTSTSVQYTQLLNNVTLMLTYNIIVIECPGNTYPTTQAQLDNVRTFVNAGGRLFATHYAYSYLYQNPPLSSTAVWNVGQTNPADQSCTIPSATTNQLSLANYIATINPTFLRVGNNTIVPTVSVLRRDFNSAVPPGELYMYTTTGNIPIVYGYDTPVGSSTACGKVIFSDFHTDPSSSVAFPAQCTTSTLTIKDQILQYFTFFLAQFTTDPSKCASKCVPHTCQSLNMACGTVGDGCGGTLTCSCPGFLKCNCQDNICEKLLSQITLVSNSTSLVFGQSVTLTANISLVGQVLTFVIGGNITFYDGDVAIGTSSVVSGLSNILTGYAFASISTSSLSVGSHIITAVYNGDIFLTVATSNSVNVTVLKASTSTSLSSSSSSVAYLATISFSTSTSVVSPGVGTPTGTVTYYEGNVALGSSSVSNRASSFSTSSLSVGSHTIFASYSGDGNFVTSNSSTVTVTVILTKANTSTSLSSSLSTSVFGQPLTLSSSTSVLSPGTGIVSGSITFYEGNVVVGTATTSNGASSLVISSLSAGTHSILASYPGEYNYTASNSSMITVTVNKASTSTFLTPSPNSVVFGQTLTLSTSTLVLSPGSGTPTGSVTFYDGTTVIGTVSMTNGASTLSVPNLTIGTHSFVAVYSGDSNYASSNSSTIPLVVARANTITSLPVIGSGVFGQSLTFSTTTSVVSPGSGTPTGTVIYYEGNIALGSSSVSNGASSFSTSSLSVGSHTIFASYSGDSKLAPSNSTSISVTINKASTTNTLSSSSFSVFYGQSLTLSSSISVVFPGAGVPTGIITFYDGTTVIGAVSFTNINVDIPLLTNSLKAGTHNISATYSGDSNFGVSSSSFIIITVNKATTTTDLSSNVSTVVFGEHLSFSTLTSVDSPGAGNPTGSITYYDGNIVVGTSSIASGASSLNTNLLGIGSHVVTASYNGDSNFVASNSSVVTITVNKAPTSTTLNSSLSTVVFGQKLTLSTSTVVLSPGSGSPTGIINFYDGSDFSSAASLLNGNSTLDTNTLSVGTHGIFSFYAGDNNFIGGNSLSVTVNVIKANTTTTLIPSALSLINGQNLTFLTTTFANSPGSGSPTGLISLYDGDTLLGTSVITNGQTSIEVPSFGVGAHTVVAVYSGDSNFNPSNSTTISISFGLNSNNLSLSASSYSVVYGENFVLSSSVITNETGTPSGSVTFYSENKIIGTSSLDSNSATTLNVNSLSVGPHNITAIYSGDITFSSSVSQAITVVVGPADTTLSIDITPLSIVYGERLDFSSNISIVAPGAGIPTGTLVYQRGSIALVTINFESGTKFKFDTSTLFVGFHRIYAIYSGDTNFYGSSSSDLFVTVDKGSTVSNISALTTTVVYGHNVTLSSSTEYLIPAYFKPSGTVIFYAGTQELGVALIDDNGIASVNTSFLSVGVHNDVYVSYSGDYLFYPSTSSYITITVTKLGTTSSLMASSNSIVFGQELTLSTNTLSVESGTPTGIVSHSEGNTILGNVSLTNGVSTFKTSSLSVGPHTFSATYSGDSIFSSSTTSTTSVTVNKANTITIVSSSSSSVVFGEELILSSSTSVSSPGAGNPTGTITFYEGSNVVGTGSISGGAASISTSSLSIGTHTFHASYSGNTNFLQSDSSTITITVSRASTTSTLSALSSSVMLGQNLTLSTSTSVELPGVGTPTGTVSFYVNNALFGNPAISNRVATLNISTLTVGTHNVFAVYSGDNNLLGSNTLTISISVGLADTTSTLSASSTSIFYGDNLSLTTSTSSYLAGTISGNVVFYEGNTVVGTAVLSDGNGTLTTSSLSIGPHTIFAIYSGDTAYATSKTSSITVVVDQASTTTNISPSLFTVVSGQTLSFTSITLSSGSGTPTGTIGFYEGDTLLGTSSMNSNKTATLDTNVLIVGSHNIFAVYSGDNNYLKSNSTTVTVTVQKASTTTFVSSLYTSVGFAQDISFYATTSISFPGSGVLSGTVAFYEGNTLLGIATLSNGNRDSSVTAKFSSVGPHTVTAIYSGDSKFTTSTSSVTITVSKTDVTCILASPTNKVVVGEPLSIVASLVPAILEAGKPTGEVNFFEGEDAMGVSPISNSAAVITTKFHVGFRTVIATYAGDSNFNAAKAYYVVFVSQASTLTTLTSSKSIVSSGETVVLTSTTTVVSPGSGLPYGVVTFYEGTTVLGIIEMDINGIASLSVSFTVNGNHPITCVYSGDFDFSNSTSSTNVSVKTDSILTNFASNYNLTIGESSTVNFILSSSSNSQFTGSLQVNITVGNTVVTTYNFQLSGNNNVTFDVDSLAPGTYTARAFYSGDDAHSPVSSSFTFIVNAASTSTNLTSSTSAFFLGETVTLTSTTVAVKRNITVNGTVSFYSDNQLLGTSQVSSDGVANLKTLFNSTGTFQVTAVFQSNGTFLSSTSNAIRLTVSQKKSNSKKAVIIGAVVGGVLGLLVLIGCTCCLIFLLAAYRRKKKEEEEENNPEKDIELANKLYDLDRKFTKTAIFLN